MAFDAWTRFVELLASNSLIVGDIGGEQQFWSGVEEI